MFPPEEVADDNLATRGEAIEMEPRSTPASAPSAESAEATAAAPDDARPDDQGADAEPATTEPASDTDAAPAPGPTALRWIDRASPKARSAVGLAVGAAVILGLTLPFAWHARRPIPTPIPAPVVVAPSTTDVVAASDPPDAAAAPPAPRAHIWRIADDAGDPLAKTLTGAPGKRGMIASLVSAGLTDKEARRIIAAFSRVRSLDHTSPRDTFIAERRAGESDAGASLTAFEYATSPFDVWQARIGDDGELTARRGGRGLHRRR